MTFPKLRVRRKRPDGLPGSESGRAKGYALIPGGVR